MAQADLTRISELVSPVDSVAVVQVLDTIRGGRTLDCSTFPDDVVSGGHLVIRETATGTFKPMPVTGTDYADLPAGHTYAGFVVASVPKSKPLASILTVGTVNHKACNYQIKENKLQEVKTALPQISLQED